jgi:hypothetical protein
MFLQVFFCSKRLSSTGAMVFPLLGSVVQGLMFVSNRSQGF